MSKLINRLLIGVSGSSLCTGIAEFLHTARSSFAEDIWVIMTPTAQKMVSPKMVELYTNAPIFSTIWDHHENIKAPHLQLGQWAETFVIIPCTANILSKAANGIADDLLSSVIISHRNPIIFAPAMNPDMWHSPAVQRNIKTLKTDVHWIVPPSEQISSTSGRFDTGLGSTFELVLKYVQHARMKELKRDYTQDATLELPLSPYQEKKFSHPE